jgi:tetratricopeptide (TPR) repeat protein
MKKIIELIAVVAVLVVPVLAGGSSQPVNAAQDQCTPENKLAWYNEFRQNFKTDTAKANELAKKWLACPEAAGEEQQAAYLKNFVTLFEKANRKGQITELVYSPKKDYVKAFELGKQILAEEPENLKVLIDLAYAGYASKNPALTADSLSYAQKAIQMIESGKTLEAWTPYLSKEDTLGYLYNATGSLNLQKDPAVALKDFIKAAQFNSKIGKLPATYATIAQTYEASAYAKLASDYEAKYKGKDETPESKLAVENINQIVDRMIDAYARAVALAGNEAGEQANKKLWMEQLTTWYKYRNKSEAGLNELIAGILAKPLPGEPTPLTTLPVSASAPATTPSDTASASGVPASGSTTKPAVPNNGAAAKPATTPATTTTAKPAAPKPTPAATPKPKRNHTRRA